MLTKVIASVILSICVLAGPAQAQLFIGEGKVSLAVSGGERVYNTLTVYNNSGEAFPVKVYWEDFEYKAPYDGSKVFLPSGTGKQSASQWVTFSPQEFRMDSFGKQIIEYSINIPPDIAGGYYGVLFFERVPENTQSEVTGVKIVTRVGSLFFIEPKDKVKKATVQDIKITSDGLSGGFSNQGNVILIPRITYYVLNTEGMVADRGEAKKMYVPPGAAASWNIAFPSKLRLNQFTFVINFDLQEGDVVVKEVDVTSDGFGNFTIQNVRD
jgi:hypothetical protein